MLQELVIKTQVLQIIYIHNSQHGHHGLVLKHTDWLMENKSISIPGKKVNSVKTNKLLKLTAIQHNLVQHFICKRGACWNHPSPPRSTGPTPTISPHSAPCGCLKSLYGSSERAVHGYSLDNIHLDDLGEPYCNR